MRQMYAVYFVHTKKKVLNFSVSTIIFETQFLTINLDEIGTSIWVFMIVSFLTLKWENSNVFIL